MVAPGKSFGELIDPRDAVRLHQLLLGRVRTAEQNIFPDGSVEEEGLLKHDTELPTKARQTNGAEVDAVYQYLTTGGIMKTA